MGVAFAVRFWTNIVSDMYLPFVAPGMSDMRSSIDRGAVPRLGKLAFTPPGRFASLVTSHQRLARDENEMNLPAVDRAVR